MSKSSKKATTSATPKAAEVITETFAVPFLSILKGQISDPVEGRSKPADRELIDFGTKTAGTLVGARDLRVSVEMDRERNLIRLVAEEAIPAGTVIADVAALSLSPSLVLRAQKSLVSTGIASKLNGQAFHLEMMSKIGAEAKKVAPGLWGTRRALGETFSHRMMLTSLMGQVEGLTEQAAREVLAMTKPADMSVELDGE